METRWRRRFVRYMWENRVCVCSRGYGYGRRAANDRALCVAMQHYNNGGGPNLDAGVFWLGEEMKETPPPPPPLCVYIYICIYIILLLLLCVCDDTAGRIVSVANNTAYRGGGAGGGRRSTSTPPGRSQRPTRPAVTKLDERKSIGSVCRAPDDDNRPASRPRRRRRRQMMTGPRL